MERKKITKVCKDCGGDQVLVDAYAEWDIDAQQWELSHTYGYSYCKDCDGETTIVDCPL